jgi:hypothetical protein
MRKVSYLKNGVLLEGIETEGYLTIVDEIIGKHHCALRHNRSTTDQSFFNPSNTEKKV